MKDERMIIYYYYLYAIGEKYMEGTTNKGLIIARLQLQVKGFIPEN